MQRSTILGLVFCAALACVTKPAHAQDERSTLRDPTANTTLLPPLAIAGGRPAQRHGAADRTLGTLRMLGVPLGLVVTF